MIESKLAKVETEVENILASNSLARNSDKVLIRAYLHNKFGTADLDMIPTESMPVMESITRARRKIQADGKYKADDGIADERDNRQLAFAFVYGK